MVDDWLDSAILTGLGGVMERMSSVFGRNAVELRRVVADGDSVVVVSRPNPEPMVLFRERLAQILEAAGSVSGVVGCSVAEAAGILLVLDGWSWNEHVFRTPVWMMDIQEIRISEARKLEGMEWLEGSSSEIKSKLSMVSAVS